MKKSILLILALLQIAPSFAKSKNKKRPSDVATKNLPIDFQNSRSAMWDDLASSKLSTMNEFPSALYDLRGFQISERAEKRRISALNYINPFIRTDETLLLGFMPITDNNKLTGIHLSERYFKIDLDNDERDFYILRPKSDNDVAEENLNTSKIFGDFFFFEAESFPDLAKAYQQIRSQFGFTPILKRLEGRTYIIGGAQVDENINLEDQSSSWQTTPGQIDNLKVKRFNLPNNHVIQHIGKFTQLSEKEHGQEDVVHKFLHQLSDIQTAMHLNTYQNDFGKLTAIPLHDFEKKKEESFRSIEIVNSNLETKELAEIINNKNQLHKDALESLLLVEDDKVQSFIQNFCQEISTSLQLSSRIAPKCFILASYQPYLQAMGGNYIFISAGTMGKMESFEELLSEILIEFAHILKGNTGDKIPLEASIGDRALPLAIAGNYFSYVSFITGIERKFIQSWFPQLALHPNSLANLGQTLIAQNLLVAASSFSMQQEFAADGEAATFKLQVHSKRLEQKLKQQFLDTVEILKN